MRIKINKEWLTSLMVLVLSVSVGASVFILGANEVTAGTQSSYSDVFYDAWGNQYCYISYTWGDSTQVTAEIYVPYQFREPDAVDWYQWDTDATAGDQAYADNETFWIDISTWTESSAMGTDSRSLLSIVRDEQVTTDGCENGVVLEFVMIHRATGNIW